MPPRIEKKNTNSVAKLLSQTIPSVEKSLNIAAPTGGVGSQLSSMLYPTSKNPNTPKMYNNSGRTTNKKNTTTVSKAFNTQKLLDEEKEKYYNPEVKDIKVNNPILNALYHNQWLMDVPVLGSVIKRGAKEVAERSMGGGYVGQMNELLQRPNEKGVLMGKDNKYSGLTNFQGNQRVMPKLVDQYFSDEPLFEKSKYKPTSDYLTFLPTYSLKSDYDKKLVTDSKLNEKFKTTINEVLGVENRGMATERRNAAIAPKVYNEFLKNKKTIYMPYSELGPMARFIGADLGAHKVGLAWDKEKNLPYISVSDAWDFEPKAWVKKRVDAGYLNEEEGKKLADQMYAQASLMHKAGKPFKVYDRFYFDPQTKNYIPDSEVSKRTKSNK
jgi:hypothetical protein